VHVPRGRRFRSASLLRGLSAIEVAREFAPSVILLNIAMPGMSGFQVLQSLRADPQTMHAAIVAYTAQLMLAHTELQVSTGGAANRPTQRGSQAL
jgi:CheY-like chemotaxis protein